jgi:hypothetical protein
MSPPIWRDESGKPRMRPCPRCGREAPILSLSLEDIRRLGWSPFAPAAFVNWYGHEQEIIPIPGAGGMCEFIPILGEAW